MVEVAGIEEVNEEEGETGEDYETKVGEVIGNNISINALIGNHYCNTMRVIGSVKRKPIHIFLDTGSTHNFMDMRIIKILGKGVEKIGTREVNVANGNKILCQYRCKEFSWEMDGD